MFLVVLLSIFAFHIGSVFPETSVTLWQFGADRLLTGATTEPLQAVGIASDGLSTTYLYEILNFQTKTIETGSGAVTTTITNPAYRTIVASASGWVESFANGIIECAFVSDGAGECFDQSSTASGAPTPIVLAATTIQTSAAFETTFPPTLISTTSSNSESEIITSQIIQSSPSSSSGTTSNTTSTTSNASRRPSTAIKTVASLLVMQILAILTF
ncbi:hypothetical protein GYMLUDRAFT_97835 [Collybiopsis luxurians FD-317 M1]|uniref:Unplaced genomic scaffold GYMLUscaffold_33, whole genome shotgun sequence n=1 Tax=Collybiopsis luxurians FD-317 M1 TaxID=944289 RepID=A0A0D0B6L1_9AGAR|nr:hypothetical protein GYMLUDRAFT_97835 [Collybiopsis luxurians FD-317 M1]